MTDERNMVSHSSIIEQYQDLGNIVAWAKFCMVIAKELSNILIKQIIKNTDKNTIKLGTYVRYLKRKHVLCVDVSTDASVDLNSVIYTKNGEAILNVYKPLSFMVDDKEVDSISINDNAGIVIDPIVETKTSIGDSDDIFVITFNDAT